MAATSLTSPPLSLYVHFPWCVRKCPYCDFNSYTLHGSLPQEGYLQALERDIAMQAQALRGRPLISVFMGGGTPSLFDPAGIARVLTAARRHFAIEEPWEVTLEANPGTIERGRFAEYAAAGVNRVSLGAQSFDGSALHALGRIHSPDETRRAVEELHAAGLTNFNLDLMYALPGQTVAGAVADIEQAIAVGPAHISHYQLTLEPGTAFAAHPPQLPSDDVAAEMLAACGERLGAAGFGRYEVSAYARADRRCRHNLNYWTFGDYVGVGAGAHGKLTELESRRIVRTTRPRDPRRYLSGSADPPAGKTVAAEDLPFEFMLNALRLVQGFEAELFERRTGLPWAIVAADVERLMSQELLELKHRRWHPTARGLEFLNDLLLVFLPKKPTAPQSYALSTVFDRVSGTGRPPVIHS